MVVNLLFPRGCAGCDKPDEVLCLQGIVFPADRTVV